LLFKLGKQRPIAEIPIEIQAPYDSMASALTMSQVVIEDDEDWEAIESKHWAPKKSQVKSIVWPRSYQAKLKKAEGKEDMQRVSLSNAI
jgi:hypothetical protein